MCEDSSTFPIEYFKNVDRMIDNSVNYFILTLLFLILLLYDFIKPIIVLISFLFYIAILYSYSVILKFYNSTILWFYYSMFSLFFNLIILQFYFYTCTFIDHYSIDLLFFSSISI